MMCRHIDPCTRKVVRGRCRVSSSITGLLIPLMLTKPGVNQVIREFQRAHVLPSPPTTALWL